MTGETPVALRCDLATLHQSAHGSITGNLEARIGEFVFPGPGWSDFVVIVLGWWLEDRGEQSVELRFMDGPYLMYVTREGLTGCTLQCCEDREERTVVFQGRVNPIQLLSETERTATEVVKACAAKKWEATPLRSLGALLNDSRYRAPLH